MSTAEEQSKICHGIMEQIQKVEEELFELKEQHRKEKIKLQKLCDHIFMREDDSDYHSRGHLYICEKCQLVTREKQKVFKLSPF